MSVQRPTRAKYPDVTEYAIQLGVCERRLNQELQKWNERKAAATARLKELTCDVCTKPFDKCECTICNHCDKPFTGKPVVSPEQALYTKHPQPFCSHTCLDNAAEAHYLWRASIQE